MYGAIFGDIIGSRFEFDRGGKTKEFDLFTGECEFTDDTVMTIAVCEALLKVEQNTDSASDSFIADIEKAVTESMQKWGKRYPDAGYGNRFYYWIFSGRKPQPYGSFGNGSAMRVSAVGWLYDSLERTREVARATANVTHNHPEGIKGAECTAAVMYLARTGVEKTAIKEYVESEFHYELSKSCDEHRAMHRHDESCQDTLPKALAAFFEGVDYEDVVRNAASLGGDTDTIAAIAGAMGEAMYGIPEAIMNEGKKYLSCDINEVLEQFDEALGRKLRS